MGALVSIIIFLLGFGLVTVITDNSINHFYSGSPAHAFMMGFTGFWISLGVVKMTMITMAFQESTGILIAGSLGTLSAAYIFSAVVYRRQEIHN